MMRAVKLFLTCAAVITFVIPFTNAELSTDPGSGGDVSTILMAIGDGPDPIDPLGWRPIRNIPSERGLNSGGYDRGDGRPDIAYRSSTWPVAVWAYNTGADFDISFSEWTGTAWSAFEFLTSSLVDELDPRLFVEADGTIHVVWWEDGATDSVRLLSRDPLGAWDAAPVLVTSDGRRPSVAVWGGVLRVAYERGSEEPDMNQDIVVARQESDESFTPEIVARTERTDRLDAILHVENGRLWVDWKHADDSISYAEANDGFWTEPAGETWSDPSWLGVEDVRRTIRRNLLAL
jgi:hypothetical protein